MTDVNENAKTAWLDLVKRHQKRQKGLPALSTLKPNAGNVELGLHMFNTFSSPDGGITVDPVNGSVTSAGEAASADCGGMGESFDNSDSREDSVKDEPKSSTKNYDNLDDDFDMSTRTLL